MTTRARSARTSHVQRANKSPRHAERHGSLLRSEELASFEPLRDDYEVGFHLRALSGGASTAPPPQPTPRLRTPPPSALAKNRRLAYLDTLEAAGFFEEAAMRERCVLPPRCTACRCAERAAFPFAASAPLLYHHHVGRFEAPPDDGVDDALGPGGAGGAAGAALRHGVAAAMLRAHDEADAAAALRAALAREAATQPESETDSDDSDAAEDVRMSAAAPPAEAAAEAAAAAGGTDPAERAACVAAFTRVMRERFLSGAEEARHGVDYTRIDADATLDERWARVAAQDAEDAYFDD